MRVALHVDGPRIRGNERQALLLVEGLARRGHAVYVSCRSRGPVRTAMEAVGAHTTGVRPRGDVDVVSALAFALWLRRRRVDAVLLTSWKRAAVAAWAARLARVPRVVLRLGGLRGAEEGVGSRVRGFALRHWYHCVVVNSDEVRASLVDRVGVSADRVRVVANGLRFEPSPSAPLREALALAADDVLLVAVTGLERNKGADLLVPILAGQAAGVHLAVAGAGTAEQRARLEASAREAGVADRFHLLGHRDDVPAVLAAADGFVLPSRMDSMPNAMLEAMAAGLPMVMSAVGGVRRALSAAGGPPAGWIAAVDDAAGLSAAVAEVVSDLRAGGAVSAARGREAARRARVWYGVDRMVSGYEEVLMRESGP